MSNAGFFVWVAGTGSPEPQKCADRPVSVGTDYWKSRVLLAIPLTEQEYGLSIDELAKKYPAPVPGDAC